MRTGTYVRWLAAIVFILLGAAQAAAQTVKPAMPDWTHGTTLNIFGGAASASSQTGPVVGGGVSWEIMPWLGIEGSGAWLDRQRDATAFAADLKAQVSFLGPAVTVPFVEGGVGLYRASFDLRRGDVPGFYRGRVSNTPTVTARRAFTDPTIVLGAGLNVFTTEHVTVTPHVRAAIVKDHSENYVVTMVLVHVAYHFERHPRSTTAGTR